MYSLVRMNNGKEQTENAGSAKAKKTIDFLLWVVILVLLLFNFFAMPWIAQRQVREVDYGTFIDMAEEQQLGQVEVQQQEQQIIFTNKDNTAIFKTGMMLTPI